MRGYGNIYLSRRTLNKGSGGSVLLDTAGDGLEKNKSMTGKGIHSEPDMTGNLIETSLGRKIANMKVSSLAKKPPKIHLG